MFGSSSPKQGVTKLQLVDKSEQGVTKLQLVNREQTYVSVSIDTNYLLAVSFSLIRFNSMERNIFALNARLFGC